MHQSKKSTISRVHPTSKSPVSIKSTTSKMKLQNPTEKQNSVGLFANDFISGKNDKILLDPPRFGGYQQPAVHRNSNYSVVNYSQNIDIGNPFTDSIRQDLVTPKSRNQRPPRDSARSSTGFLGKNSPHNSSLYHRDSPNMSRELTPRSLKRSFRERPSPRDTGGYYRNFLRKMVGNNTGISRENSTQSINNIGLQFESFMHKLKGRKDQFISNVEYTTNKSFSSKPQEVRSQPIKLEPAKNPLLNLSLDEIIKDNELFKSATHTPESKHQLDVFTTTKTTNYTVFGTKPPQFSTNRLVSDPLNESMTRRGDSSRHALAESRRPTSTDDIMIIPEIESEVMKMRKELILMENVLSHREAEIAMLRQKNEELSQRLQKEQSFDNKSELIRLRAEVEKFSNDKKLLEKELSSTKEQMLSLQKSAQAYDSQIQEARLQASLNLATKSEKEEDLKRQNEQLAKEIKNLQDSNETLKKKLSERQSITQVSLEPKKTNDESEKKLKEALDREAALKNQVEMMKQTIDGKIKEINLLKQVPKEGNAAQQELQKLKSEFSGVTQENERNKTIIKDLKDQISSMEAKLNESQAKINQLDSQPKLTPRKSDAIIESQKQITPRSTNSVDNAEVANLRTENTKLQKDLSIIVTRFEGMKKELMEAREKVEKQSQGKQSQMQAAPQQTEELQKEIEHQQTQIIELSSRMMMMQQEKDELAKKYNDFLNDKSKVSDKEKAARTEAEKFKSENAKLISAAKDSEKKFFNLQKEAEKKLADTIKDQEKKLTNLQKDFEKKLVQADKTILDLKTQITKITAKDKVAATAEEFRVLSEKLNAELIALREQHAEGQQKIAKLMEENAAMKTDIEQKNLIMSVPVTNEEMTDSLVAKTREILVLKEELQKLKGL